MLCYCLSRCDLRSPGMLLSRKVGKLWSLLLAIDCCSNRIRLAFDMYMLIENKLGGQVILTFGSVMASSGPLKKIDCLNILFPYVESHSELLSRLE